MALGINPDGSPWRIGIRHPRQENGLIGLVSVEDKAVVTSGDYQRYFIDGRGNRWHHILDPSTGYPAKAGLVGVTVVADNSMVADALSTMLFVAGLRRGLELIRGFDGAEAVFIDAGSSVCVTKGLKDRFLAAEGVRVDTVQ